MKSAVAAAVVAVAMLAFPGISLGASLNVVPNGPEGVTVTVAAAGTANPPCAALAIKATARGVHRRAARWYAAMMPCSSASKRTR